MKSKKIVESFDPESITVFGLPLRITPEIRDVTFRLSQTNPEKYAAIKKSIAAANGKLDEPIKVFKLGSETGDYYTIVDGHTRFEILMDLKILPPDSNFAIVPDLFSVADAKTLAYRLNDLRRQADIYQQAVNAIRANPTLAEREIAEVSGVSQKTINRVKYILESIDSKNKTEIEMGEILKLQQELESGETGVETVCKQLKVAEEVFNAITAIDNDDEFQTKMLKQFEADKYTDRAAAKKLQEEIRLHEAEKEGIAFEATPYDKDVYPVKTKLIKLQEKYSGVNTVSCAGTQEAITNAINSVRSYLMNNMNENITDVLEGVRNVLIENLEQKREKDLSVIMAKVTEMLAPSKTHGYFIATMELPNNPKGVNDE
jgi:ParB-like chromosome segregation protein Spo0J